MNTNHSKMYSRCHRLRHGYRYIIMIVAIFMVLYVLFVNLKYFKRHFSHVLNSEKIDLEREWESFNVIDKKNKEAYRQYRSRLAEQHSKTNANKGDFVIAKAKSHSSSQLDFIDEFKHSNRTTGPCSNKDVVPILILTPGKNMDSDRIKTYFSNMLNLTYPHCLIRIVIGVNEDEQSSIDHLTLYSKSLANEFYSVDIVTLNFTSESLSDREKHLHARQLVRRSHIARVRNALLLTALANENWVLWVDCDVKMLPGDIIETLISSKKDIVVPSCMYEPSPGWFDIYDRNTWRDTEESLAFLKHKPEEFLMIEGPGKSLRKYLPDLSSEGNVVPIDGVGGCCLLVHADVHRKGVIFPDFVFKHHIETEGFAKMAQSMGYSMYGMPKVYVLHS